MPRPATEEKHFEPTNAADGSSADEAGAYPSPETDSIYRELLATAPDHEGRRRPPQPQTRGLDHAERGTCPE